MSKTLKPTLVVVAILGGGCGEPCYDNPNTEDVSCDAEVCPGEQAPSGETGETGEDGPFLCTPYYEPEFVGETMLCNGEVSQGEHCVQDAANNYGITDYAFETGNYTLAMKFDFQPIPEIVVDGVHYDWFTWEGNWLTAVPGVVTHEDQGQTWAAYMSRGCCTQVPVGPNGPDKTVPNEACAGGYTLNETPDAWCIGLLDGTRAGLCVYPCTTAADCPNPAGEWCDLGHPDPGGHGPGVCRYNSMPLVPTPLTEIGDHQPPQPLTIPLTESESTP